MRQQLLAAVLGVGSVSAGVQALPSTAPTECATSAGQLAMAARNAGLPADRIVTAVAIAGAESGFRLDAEKVDFVESSYGPWQVNRDAHAQYSVAELESYDGAARAMFEISGAGENFRPWTMWVNGGYKAHLDEANAVAHCAGAVSDGHVEATSAGVLEGGYDRPARPRKVGNLVDAAVAGAVDKACAATVRAAWARSACDAVNDAMAGD